MQSTTTETCPDQPTQFGRPVAETQKIHRQAEDMSLPYAVIKMFSDFGHLAGKPLAPGGVEELTQFWGRIQQLVVAQQFSVALVKRCVAGAAKEARRLSGDEARIQAHHVREAVHLVRAQAGATAGLICRPPGS